MIIGLTDLNNGKEILSRNLRKQGIMVQKKMLILVVIFSTMFLISVSCGDDDNDSGISNCKDEETRCEGDVVSRCNSGEWESWNDCRLKGMRCTVSMGNAVCTASPSSDSDTDSDSDSDSDSDTDSDSDSDTDSDNDSDSDSDGDGDGDGDSDSDADSDVDSDSDSDSDSDGDSDGDGDSDSDADCDSPSRDEICTTTCGHFCENQEEYCNDSCASDFCESSTYKELVCDNFTIFELQTSCEGFAESSCEDWVNVGDEFCQDPQCDTSNTGCDSNNFDTVCETMCEAYCQNEEDYCDNPCLFGFCQSADYYEGVCLGKTLLEIQLVCSNWESDSCYDWVSIGNCEDPQCQK